MSGFSRLGDVARETDSRIVMLVVDGLGGLPHPDTGRSELETARTPNLDRLAQGSSCGLTVPVLPGISPGSGPGHLSLFGYDPVTYLMGRGVLEVLGIGVELREGEVAARGNFCTVDEQGRLTDRRAGRISTEEITPLCNRLAGIKLDGAELDVYPVKEHRFALVMRGEGLGDNVTQTDPEEVGVPPDEPRPLEEGSRKTADLVRRLAAAAREALRDQQRANMVLLRGFARLPRLPSMGERYRLRPAAVAAYPMYRGLASLVGMRVIPTGSTFDEEIESLHEHYGEHDFFYLHYKAADAAGEDGDFEAKTAALEALDAMVPRVEELRPDVLVVAGDHATPAVMATHTWHPVPALLRSRWTAGTGSRCFCEREFASGSLGTFPAEQLMPLVLAHAGKLSRYGP